jgi:hypothetical protein
MAKRPTPATRAAQSAQADVVPLHNYPVPTPPPASPSDISAVLLELLRKVNSEVQTRPPLDARALLAVQNFQRISNDLRTLADPPATSGV